VRNVPDVRERSIYPCFCVASHIRDISRLPENPSENLHENTFANCIGEIGKYPSMGFCRGVCFFLLHLPPFLLYLH
jgi:hypothetical protein